MKPNDNSNWCIYNNVDSCNLYGRHYDFNSAKTACPVGYHLPTPKEFDTLIMNTGGDISGIQLKAISGFPKYYDMEVNGTDAFGFCSLPNTRRDPNGVVVIVNKGNEYYWTSEKYSDQNGIRYLIGHGQYNVSVGSDPIGNGFSVRCINDTSFNEEQKIKIDTIIKLDTISMIIKQKDTVKIYTPTKDISTNQRDTIKIHDTVHVTKIDTVVDTLQLCNVVNRKYTEEIYPKHMLTNSFGEEGLSAWISKDGQTYKNVNDNRERSDKDFLNYVSVRIKTNFVGKYKVYVYDNSSVFVNDIDVKVSDEYKYSDYTLMITFNGKSKFGKIVSDGVYLLRVISQQENSFGNNVYKIGVKLN